MKFAEVWSLLNLTRFFVKFSGRDDILQDYKITRLLNNNNTALYFATHAICLVMWDPDERRDK